MDWSTVVVGVAGIVTTGVVGIKGQIDAVRLARDARRQTSELAGDAVEHERIENRRPDVRDFRRARRLVLIEIDTIKMHYDLVVTERRLPIQSAWEAGGIFPTDDWEACRGILATSIVDETAWNGLANFMYTVARMRSLLSGQEPGSEMTPEILRLAAEGNELAPMAQQSLEQASLTFD
jgi:hypothetical protein